VIRIEELIADLPIEIRAGPSHQGVRLVVEDSRRVEDGALFVARPGTETDGRRYVREAIENGATAVLSGASFVLEDAAAPITHLVTDDVPRMGAILAERAQGDPSRRLALIGVTGTNGKTTVATLVHQMLNGAGMRCGLIGTVAVDEGDGVMKPATLTTPSADVISATLARMVAAGCTACVMEASSHALDQARTAGLHFAGGVFTNLSGDHLDYHGTMAAYARAKARLFAALGPDAWAVVNGDDGAAAIMADAARGAGADVVMTRVCGAGGGVGGGDAGGVEVGGADCLAEVLAASIDGIETCVRGPWGSLQVLVPLVGRHNLANALQAAAVGHRLGLTADDLAVALRRAGAPPGRLEPVITGAAVGDRVRVFVDYAHTDDALAHALGAVGPLVPPGRRLHVVFGCGGDRDRAKRPRMGRVAARGADRLIVTSDNPRTEDPASIIEEIVAGLPGDAARRTLRIADRRQAIRLAIAEADPGDVVVIAGKGHEDYQIIGRVKRPFDDRIEAQAALANRPAAGGGAGAFGRSGSFGGSAGSGGARVGDRPFFDAENLRAVTGGRWQRRPLACDVAVGLGTDTRDDLRRRVFVALRGDNFDGHDHLAAALAAGSTMAIVARQMSAGAIPDGMGVLVVDDTRRALGRLASAYRRTLIGTRVIAVTGSSGKTTTKELIHAVLSSVHRGTAALRSFNNDIGVPLTILAARAGDKYLVVEVGANAPGEIAALAAIVEPDIAVITSIGRAHVGGFGSPEAIVREKAALLAHLRPGGLAIVNADVPELSRYLRIAPSVVGFGSGAGADLRLTGRGRVGVEGGDEATWWLEVNGRTRFRLGLPGRHNALNAMAAIAVGRRFGLADEQMSEALARVEPASMRMTVHRIATPDGPIVVYNDAYNANPESMAAALDSFAELSADARRRVVVLGDMLELGAASAALHGELGERLIDTDARVGLDHAVLVGTETTATAAVYARSRGDASILTRAELDPDSIEVITAGIEPGDAVLLKASRGLALERVLAALAARWSTERSITPAPRG